MTDKDILISDLNDISEILNNNGYGGWCKTIRKAVAMLKEYEVKTYGKLYCISAEAVANDRHKVEQKLYADIAKCLMENGVLVIHSEETIPGIQFTYGWKLKGESYRQVTGKLTD